MPLHLCKSVSGATGIQSEQKTEILVILKNYIPVAIEDQK